MDASNLLTYKRQEQKTFEELFSQIQHNRDAIQDVQRELDEWKKKQMKQKIMVYFVASIFYLYLYLEMKAMSTASLALASHSLHTNIENSIKSNTIGLHVTQPSLYTHDEHYRQQHPHSKPSKDSQMRHDHSENDILHSKSTNINQEATSSSATNTNTGSTSQTTSPSSSPTSPSATPTSDTTDSQQSQQKSLTFQSFTKTPVSPIFTSTCDECETLADQIQVLASKMEIFESALRYLDVKKASGTTESEKEMQNVQNSIKKMEEHFQKMKLTYNEFVDQVNSQFEKIVNYINQNL